MTPLLGAECGPSFQKMIPTNVQLLAHLDRGAWAFSDRFCSEVGRRATSHSATVVLGGSSFRLSDAGLRPGALSPAMNADEEQRWPLAIDGTRSCQNR